MPNIVGGSQNHPSYKGPHETGWLGERKFYSERTSLLYYICEEEGKMLVETEDVRGRIVRLAKDNSLLPEPVRKRIEELAEEADDSI